MRDWVRRYGVAEVLGMALAFTASIVARRLGGNAIAAGYAAAWGETIGYAGLIIIRDYLRERRASRSRGHETPVRDAGVVAWGLVEEFGPASVMDTFVTRPLAMATGVRFLGPVLGIVAGKIAADALFYGPVIHMYERRKRRRAQGGS